MTGFRYSLPTGVPEGAIGPPPISPTTVLYAPLVQDADVQVPFIAAATVFYVYGFSLALPLADSVSLADALGIGHGPKIADTVGLADSMSRTHAATRTPADVVVVRDGLLEIQWGDGTDHKLLLEGDPVSVTDSVRIQHGLPRQFTQTPIEALVEPVAKAQFTQTPIEALVYLESDAQFTQIPVEVLVTPAVITAQFTQVAIEVLRRVQNETYEVVYID